MLYPILFDLLLKWNSLIDLPALILWDSAKVERLVNVKFKFLPDWLVGVSSSTTLGKLLSSSLHDSLRPDCKFDVRKWKIKELEFRTGRRLVPTNPQTSREMKNWNSTRRTTKIKISVAPVDREKNSLELALSHFIQFVTGCYALRSWRNSIFVIL